MKQIMKKDIFKMKPHLIEFARVKKHEEEEENLDEEGGKKKKKKNEEISVIDFTKKKK